MIDGEQVVEADDKELGNGFGGIAVLDAVVQEIVVGGPFIGCGFRWWRGRRFGERGAGRGQGTPDHHRRDDDEGQQGDFPFPVAGFTHALHYKQGGGAGNSHLTRGGASP